MTPRFEFTPLEAHIARIVPQEDMLRNVRRGTPRLATDGSIADQIGHGKGSITQWRRRGYVHTDLSKIEDFCDRLGVFPFELWPDWYQRIDDYYQAQERAA